MTAADGKTMTIGISVDGDEVAAYACNGTDDEAWFFGNQTDGSIDIKSRFRDTLQAEFDGGNVDGDLNMNGVAYQFTAKPVTGEAGMYTAALDGTRASWVVRENGSADWRAVHQQRSTIDINVFELERRTVPRRGAQQAAAPAGTADRAPAERQYELQDQRPRRDADPGQRKFPARLTTRKLLPPNGPAGVLHHIGRADLLCIIQNQNLLAPCTRA